MKLRKADITHLYRDTERLFKWTSKGIILSKGALKINLNELNDDDRERLFDNMSDSELTICQKNDIKEVEDFFKKY